MKKGAAVETVEGALREGTAGRPQGGVPLLPWELWGQDVSLAVVSGQETAAAG